MTGHIGHQIQWQLASDCHKPDNISAIFVSQLGRKEARKSRTKEGKSSKHANVRLGSARHVKLLNPVLDVVQGIGVDSVRDQGCVLIGATCAYLLRRARL